MAYDTTGQKWDEVFCMPNGKVQEASDMDEFRHDIRHPTKDMHIDPGIKHVFLASPSSMG
jgi:hypothetical protein